jgi:hypothetical protein
MGGKCALKQQDLNTQTNEVFAEMDRYIELNNILDPETPEPQGVITTQGKMYSFFNTNLTYF